MESAEEQQQHSSSSKQQLFDIEAAASESKQEQLRQLGRSKLDAVLNTAQAGHDPFEHQERPQRLGGDGAGRWLPHTGDSVQGCCPNCSWFPASAEVQDADVAAMGAWLERHRPLLLAGGFVVTQGGSWVLLKVRPPVPACAVTELRRAHRLTYCFCCRTVLRLCTRQQC